MDCPHCRAQIADGSAACSACGVDLVKLKAREVLAKLKRDKPAEVEGPPWAKSAVFLGALAVGACLLLYGAALIAGRSVVGRGPAPAAAPAPVAEAPTPATPEASAAPDEPAAPSPARVPVRAVAAAPSSATSSKGLPDVGYNKGNPVRLTPQYDGTWTSNAPLPLTSPGSKP